MTRRTLISYGEFVRQLCRLLTITITIININIIDIFDSIYY